MEPRRVLTFREVARRGSFSRAAEALALTQPAVSQQVAALEREVGARLLDRGPGGLTLTDAGRLLLEHADVVSDRLALAAGQLGELVAERGRLLRVGAFPSAVATTVPVALARLTEQLPELKADVVEGSTADLVDQIRSGAIHVAICFEDAAQPPREHEGTARLELEVEPFVALVPRDHRLAGKGPLELADLAGDTWVAPSREGILARACAGAGFTPAIRYVSRDPLANRGLVAGGLAVTLSPAGLAAELGGIAVEEVRDAPRRRVYALLPATGATRLARAFAEALRTSARSGGGT